jgi:uncharacterized repeat protein (TIGR04138 family)
MHEVSFDEALAIICGKDVRFAREGYLFVRDALNHTQKEISKKNRNEVRHVTGQELLAGIRDYALAQYGPMATMLFQEWGIKDCRDFGVMVFNMVDAGWLAKTETDSITDFETGYDFYEAFQKPFLPASKRGDKEVSSVEQQATQAGL